MVVAILGLAEFVEEEDDGLQTQDQHYSTDEACSVESVLVRGGRGGNWCGSCAGSICRRGWRRRAGAVTSVSRSNGGMVCTVCGGQRAAAVRGGGGDNRGRGGCSGMGRSHRGS